MEEQMMGQLLLNNGRWGYMPPWLHHCKQLLTKNVIYLQCGTLATIIACYSSENCIYTKTKKMSGHNSPCLNEKPIRLLNENKNPKAN